MLLACDNRVLDFNLHVLDDNVIIYCASVVSQTGVLACVSIGGSTLMCSSILL
jgi:hypothetical protein